MPRTVPAAEVRAGDTIIVRRGPAQDPIVVDSAIEKMPGRYMFTTGYGDFGPYGQVTVPDPERRPWHAGLRHTGVLPYVLVLVVLAAAWTVSVTWLQPNAPHVSAWSSPVLLVALLATAGGSAPNPISPPTARRWIVCAITAGIVLTIGSCVAHLG